MNILFERDESRSPAADGDSIVGVITALFEENVRHSGCGGILQLTCSGLRDFA